MHFQTISLGELFLTNFTFFFLQSFYITFIMVNIFLLCYRWLFWRMERNNSPNSHQKIWRTNSLRMRVLLEVISDIHRVRINPEDPMDVRNDPQQDTCPQAVSSSNFLMWIWGVISFHSSKKSLVKELLPVKFSEII